MRNYPKSKLEIKAWNFAREKHKDQVRKFSGSPYFDSHVQKVNGILKLYTSNEIMLSASLLHDVIEDCYEDKDIGYEDILLEFGEDIADIVYELTTDEEDLRVNYFDCKTSYLIDKMLNMTDESLLIKLCDRYQNINDAFIASDAFRTKYYFETKEIVSNLHKLRKLTARQRSLMENIESKLKNINSIFKVELRSTTNEKFLF